MIGVKLQNRYELTAELGHGGMGVVYRAHDPLLDREVAVKMIPPARWTSAAEKRFLREARTVAQLDHPSIVPIYDFGNQDGSIFFVMPVVEGTTVRALIREGELPLGEILEIAVQAAEALAYSHSQGVAHGDVKPGNLMVSRTAAGMRVRIMDFGLARDAAGTARIASLVGTIAYMSPELIQSRHLDRFSDIYSLGVVLYECLAGEPPFVGASTSVAYRIGHQAPQGLAERGVDIDHELENLVLSCLEKDPHQRPASGEVLATALRGYAAGLDSHRQATVIRPENSLPGYRAAAAPLVGRDNEWRQLAGRLYSTIAGEFQLVLIAGDVGTGKSRLLAELEHLARGRGVRVFHGRIADRGALPFQGICELILDGFRKPDRITSDSSHSTTEATIDDGFADLAANLVHYFPALSEVEVLRGAARLSTLPRTVERPEPIYLFELLACALGWLADGEPLVLMLEHLHSGDVSIEALDYIVRRLSATPILIAGTYRPAAVDRGHPLQQMLHEFHDDRRVGAIRLQPFNAKEFRQWLEWLIGSSELDAELVTQLHEATEANPFFCQELVRSLLESERIRRDDSGRWVLARRATRRGRLAGALPATIHQAVTGRIEHLPEIERRVLAEAAVLGRAFELRDLEDLGEEGDDLDTILDALIARDLLREDPPRSGRLRFASSMLRDVLYQGLPRRRRRHLHRLHAEALEKRFADNPAPAYPRLVEHFSAAEVADSTVRYGLLSAREALSGRSPGEARLAVRRALESIDDAESADRESVRAELLQIDARALRDEEDLNLATDRAGAAVEAFERAGLQARASEAALLAAETAWQERRGATAQRWIETGTDLARQAGETEVLRRLLALGTTVANLRGEHQRAQDFLEEAVSLAPAAPDLEEPPPRQGGKLVVGFTNPVSSLEPGGLKTAEEFEVAACVFETLLRTDAKGDVIPGLCDGWQSSDDRRTFELELRPGTRFSDGRELDAGTVKRSFERTARLTEASPVPALSALDGYDAYIGGETEEITGIEVLADDRIAFHTSQPLPIFPVLLTNLKTAILRRNDSEDLIGTGPFRFSRIDARSIVLERHPHRQGRPEALLDTIEIRPELTSTEIADGLRGSTIDLGRDLLPEELDELLRDSNLRRGLVEATKKNVYFMLFNQAGPVAHRARVRQALTGVVDARELVWRTLGRFAEPAVGLIPPGIFGHEAGRRPGNLRRDHARELLRKVDGGPIRLRAAVHPLLQDRYGSLTSALITTWAKLGVELDAPDQTMESFIRSIDHNGDFDVLLCRWIADYDDPDNFTYELFHSRHGFMRHYYSSEEGDQLLEKARQQTDPDLRRTLYRRFEDLLARDHVLLPLFHDVDYRIAGQSVRGLRLQDTPPYVDYLSLAVDSSGGD